MRRRVARLLGRLPHRLWLRLPRRVRWWVAGVLTDDLLRAAR